MVSRSTLPLMHHAIRSPIPFHHQKSICGTHVETFPVDLWLTDQIELELISIHLALNNILL